MTDNTSGRIDDDEIRGCALAAFTLSTALLTFIIAKKLMNDAQVDEFLEGVLQSLERFPAPTDPGLRKARSTIEALAHVVTKGRAPRRQP